MDLKKTIESEMKAAMKSRDTERLGVFRMLLSALKNKEIEKRPRVREVGLTAGSPTYPTQDLTEEEATAVLKNEVRKRRDSIAEFQKAGRTDLAEKEVRELAALEPYLPAEISDGEIEKILVPLAQGSIEKDFGRVMAAAMKAVSGRASGERVSAAVKRLLALDKK